MYFVLLLILFCDNVQRGTFVILWTLGHGFYGPFYMSQRSEKSPGIMIGCLASINERLLRNFKLFDEFLGSDILRVSYSFIYIFQGSIELTYLTICHPLEAAPMWYFGLPLLIDRERMAIYSKKFWMLYARSGNGDVSFPSGQPEG